MTRSATKPITTDIVLVDIINFSKLSTHQQAEIITFLTKSYIKMIKVMLKNSNLQHQKLFLGNVSTGDGFYTILNPRLKGFGAILGLSFNHFSELIAKKYPYFEGIRIAVHYGEVLGFKDILGQDNYIGKGLNDCARYLELKEFSISTVIISKESYRQFEMFLVRYKHYDRLLLKHELKRSQNYIFRDKHGIKREGVMIWLRRGGIINPPDMNFNSLLNKR